MTTEDELVKLNVGDRITVTIQLLMEVVGRQNGETQLKQVK